MQYGEAKKRREEILTRELDIHATLTEFKRAWVADKIESSFVVRTALDAELARLAVEKNRLTVQINTSKNAMKVYRTTLAHAILIRLVTDRGMSDLVIEADRAAIDIALSATGDCIKAAIQPKESE